MATIKTVFEPVIYRISNQGNMESKLKPIVENEVSQDVSLDEPELFYEAVKGKDLKLPQEEILRIEEAERGSWGGVTNCDHSDRIQQELKRILDNWARNQIFRHRSLRVIRYGATVPTVTVRTTHSRDWDGKRSCSSGTVIPCFIEFRRP